MTAPGSSLVLLSFRSYGRHLRSTLGVPASGLVALGAVVGVLCLVATGLAAGAVLSLDLTGLGSEQLALLREDFARGVVFLSVCVGIFVTVTSTPGTALRLLLRTTGGSRRDRYLLIAAPRDVLCLVVPLVVSAVAYVPLITLVRGQLGSVTAIVLVATQTAAVSVLAAGSVECLRTGLKVVRPGLHDGFATALACGVVAAGGLALAPLSLLPWEPVVAWTAFDATGGVGGAHTLGHLTFLVGVVVVWWSGYLLAVTSDRATAVLQPPVAFRVAKVGGRGPVTTLISLFAATTLRVPVVMMLVALSWACAGLAHLGSTDLSRSVFLISGAGLAGSIGLRAHGAELTSRWLVLRLAPSASAVAWALPVATLVVSVVVSVPVLASAAVLFEPRAVGYFLLTVLTTCAFTLFAGTVVPVSTEEPLTTVTAGAVSFALSGGVVGAIESGLADRSESWAAVVASTVALVAVLLTVLLARYRYERSVLP